MQCGVCWRRLSVGFFFFISSDEQAVAKQGPTTMSLGTSGMFSPISCSSINPLQLKQCRSTSESMDVDSISTEERRVGEPPDAKLARTDHSFSSRNSSQHMPSDLQMQQIMMAAESGSLVRSNSMLSDSRLQGCSPTDSSASVDGAVAAVALLHHSDSSTQQQQHFLVEQRLTQNDATASGYGGASSLYPSTAFSLQSPCSGFMVGHSLSMHDTEWRRAPVLFTPGQISELQLQALVLKYMLSGVKIPAELIYPIRSSVMRGASAISANLPWGGYRLGFGANTDPEPGRCRRTDGKKWRCAREVVPDQKYCERHMHRGRQRSRKAADANQQTTPTTSSQAVSVSSSCNAASSVSLAASRVLSTIPSSTVSLNQQSPNLGVKPFSGGNSPNGLSVGSSITASQFQMPVQSAARATKDYGYFNGIVKSELDSGPEQILFAEAIGSSRAPLGQDLQAFNGLTMLSSINNSWRPMQQSRGPSPQHQTNSDISSLIAMQEHYTSSQPKTFLGQDFRLMSDVNSVDMQSLQAQQQSPLFPGAGFQGSVAAVRSNHGSGHEPCERQPLRHFFDEWPRPSRDSSTLSWSDVGDEKSNLSSSTTQLSISIPMADSLDITNSSSRGKLTFSPLKLSMSGRDAEDDPLRMDATTQMGLGMGMGLGISSADRHQQHAPWIPIAQETPVGGPLAEVLQPSTPQGSSKGPGLNLMTDVWERSPQSLGNASPSGETDA